MPIETPSISSARYAAPGTSSAGSLGVGLSGGESRSSARRPYGAPSSLEDTADFSPAGLTAARKTLNGAEPEQRSTPLFQDPDSEDLTGEEQQKLDELEERDREVRRHEQAHKAAAGSYARGGANLEYTSGPDGKRYATGGNVKIDVSPERTPEATIQKMRVIQRAALAPADPSPQDRAVYRSAVRQEQSAREQLVEEQRVHVENAASHEQAQPVVPPNEPFDSAGPFAARIPRDALRPDAAADEPTAFSGGAPNAAPPNSPFAPAKRPPITQQQPPTATLDLRA